MLGDLPSRVIHKPGRYAVLLNARAKRWTGKLHEAVSRWVPSKDLFLTDDFRQARKTVERILSAGVYEVIFTGGGDGTIVYLLNAIEEQIAAGRISREEAPPVGVLRMGTGNAIATYLECRNVVEDLRALSGGSPIVVYDLHMVKTAEGLVPFAGLGWDATILNDYDSFKESVRGTAMENIATGLGGYAASIVTRSIPGALATGRSRARITANGHVVRIHPQTGEELDEYFDGDLIYEGVVDELCGSTIPYWGFEVRMFPFCTSKPGYFELRAYHGGIRNILKTVPTRFWAGDFGEHEAADFLATDVSIEVLEGAMPYHVAGDPGGYERSVRWGISEHPAHLAVPLR
jgi:hypothetical protein